MLPSNIVIYLSSIIYQKQIYTYSLPAILKNFSFQVEALKSEKKKKYPDQSKAKYDDTI